MQANTSPLLVFAGICFATAALTFVVFIVPGLIWRARVWSWKRWLVFSGAAAVLALLYFHLARIVLG